jgi:chorismate dehydratase
MKKIRISAVSYLNTYPFLYGIYSHTDFLEKIEITTDYPSLCAKKLLSNSVDIGLVPVAILPELKTYTILTDYCIGAAGRVESVLLFSDIPIEKVSRIFLDYQSRTSVNLTKILCKYHWKIQPDFFIGKQGYEFEINGDAAGLIIGDRALNLRNKFRYVYDLAAEWKKMTGLPFVFATWTANKSSFSDEFLVQFNNVLHFGVSHIDDALVYFDKRITMIDYDAKMYLSKNIDYKLNEKKYEAIDLYLKLMQKI